MILSNSKKFIFIKTRKCGGTSIQNTLLPYCNDDDFVTLGFTNLITKRVTQLQEFSNLNDIKKIFKINLDEYYKFAFVRNPYSITLSRFFYQLKQNRINLNPTKEDFNLWVKNDYFVNHKEFNYKGDKFSKFLFNYKNEPIVDFIGKLENVENDFLIIKEKLNINKNLKLNTDNKSNFNNVHYKDWMTEETINLVNKFFEFELSYFNYMY